MGNLAIRVLVVEDEPIYADQLEAYLQDLGCEFIGPAADARIALSLFRTEAIDLVLLDVHLRGPVDGIELAAQLRAIRPVPLIFLTSRADDAAFARARLLGPAAYLIKPVAADALQRAMALAVDSFTTTATLANTAAAPPATFPGSIPEALFVKENGMLEKIRIASAKDGLLIAPATWVRDLDGNGTVSTSERYFFAIPARKDGNLAFQMPSEDEDYYAREYKLDATVRIDQTDILWGLSYHYYVEAIVEVLLSYQYQRDADTPSNQVIRLAHPENMRRARELIVSGLKTSEKMRLSALAETDDDMEWLSNPRQASSAFPVPLDDTDFRIWGELMGHLMPLFQGKTLLAPGAGQGGMLGSLGSLCPAGKGISLQAFFQNPPQYPLEFFSRPDAQLYCRKIDGTHPASGLFAFITKYAEAVENNGGAGMRFLRRLLWVN